jgi:L-alanine-DL-glutamate epimerase-like enolase superfamily enzyme
LAHRWTIAHGLEPGGSGGTNVFKVVFVELTDADGVTGLGEAAPSSRYGETADEALAFIQKVPANRLSFADVAGSMAYLDSLAPGHLAAKGALNTALLDGAARRAGQPIYDWLNLGFTENKHLTSFSIGIDKPEMIRLKVREAESFPVLKLKVGSPDDARNLAALREVAPKKWIRVDANEAWKTKEQALERLEGLAADGHVQFVEQPMPAATPLKDLVWLKSRSPLQIMADESYHFAKDIRAVADWAHAVNVKLVKSGGVSAAYDALLAARKAGLQTMLGCMIESSVLITAAAHLAELTDYLDLDGNLLITNDPYRGVTAKNGMLSFADAPEKRGLRVRAK